MPTGIAAIYPFIFAVQSTGVSPGCAVPKSVTQFEIAVNPAVESKRRFGYNARPVYPVAVG
jgi:hypothetical protein